jgi:D-alanine-D-alanine ligase
MHIVVLMGGVSSEREISVLSSFEITKALRALGHQVTVIEMTEGVLTQAQEARWFSVVANHVPPLEKEKQELPLANLLGPLNALDKVFIGLHGGRGENGSIQAELESLGIPFTGSGSLACALAMDKHKAKDQYIKSGLPTPEWELISAHDAVTLGYPVIIKPNQEGSSVGLRLVHNPTETTEAIEFARNYDDAILVEAYIEGQEYTVGVLGDRALMPGGIYPKNSKLFDYESKYQAHLTDEIFPPEELSSYDIKHLQDLALSAHRVLNLSGYSRTDFMRDGSGNFYLLETNTLPGLTQNSLLPKSALASDIDFLELIKTILG